MAITRSSDLTNAAVTNYKKEYLELSLQRKEVWGQFVDWDDPIPDDGGFGGTRDILAFGELDPVETALVEDSDVTPEAITDYNVTVTPYEYGRAVGKTQVASFKSRVRLQQVMARMVANDRINSIDRLIRRAVCGRGSSYPTQTYMPNGNTAMSGLDATNDKVTFDFIMELVTRAKAQGIEPMDGNNFVAVIHPLLHYDLMKLTEFVNARYYRSDDTTLFQGEVGQVGGLRIIVTPQGRIHPGSGTAAQAATTLSAPAAKGATTITVAAGTGLANGDYIHIGTVETESTNPGSNLETVQIVSGGGTTSLTIRGLGDGTSFGLRFAHASGEAVTEAATVADIPIIGRNSLIGIYGARTGRYGEAIYKEGLDILDRIAYFGWYWYGGVARVEKNLILGRVATTMSVLGYN